MHTLLGMVMSSRVDAREVPCLQVEWQSAGRSRIPAGQQQRSRATAPVLSEQPRFVDSGTKRRVVRSPCSWVEEYTTCSVAPVGLSSIRSRGVSSRLFQRGQRMTDVLNNFSIWRNGWAGGRIESAGPGVTSLAFQRDEYVPFRGMDVPSGLGFLHCSFAEGRGACRRQDTPLYCGEKILMLYVDAAAVVCLSGWQ